jgi:hypothetical protein
MWHPKTVRAADEFGRVRLSHSFFMRDFLYSDISNVHGIPNLPSDPDLAIIAGRRLCEELLEPLQATFGRLAIRSAYRSCAVNAFGNAERHNCASNERIYARHIWDRGDARGSMGAMACIVIPWFVDRLAEATRWRAMPWWIHDHLPYSQMQFFSKLSAFNIGWQECPKREIYSFTYQRGYLTRPGMPNHSGNHADHYPGFPDVLASSESA